MEKKNTRDSAQESNHFRIVQGKIFLGFSWTDGDWCRGNVLYNVLLDFGDCACSALLHLPVTVDAAAHLLLVLVKAVSGDKHRLRGGTGLDPGLGDRFNDDRLLRGHLYNRECHRQTANLRSSLAFDI